MLHHIRLGTPTLVAVLSSCATLGPAAQPDAPAPAAAPVPEATAAPPAAKEAEGAQALAPPPAPARVLWAVEPVDNTSNLHVLEVSGSGVVVLGDNRVFVTSPDDMFIERLAEDGTVVWHKSGTAKWTRWLSGTSQHMVFATEFSGKLDFEGVRAYAPESAAFIAKMSPAGELAWGRVLATPSFTRVSQVAATADGGAVAALGIFMPAGRGPLAIPVAGGEDAVVVKYDGSGQVAWVKSFHWAGYDDAAAVLAADDGDILVAGTRWKSPNTWSSALSDGPCHGWVAKLGPNGEQRWLSDLGADTRRVTIRSMVPAAKGAVVVSGMMHGRNRLGPAELVVDGVKERPYVAKLDAAGKVVWAREHAPDNCIAVDAADRLVVAGPKGVTVETSPTESTSVLAFGDETVWINDCRLDGAHTLYLSGVAKPGSKIGEVTLKGPVRTRARTGWVKPYQVGFVAKLAW